MAENWSFRIGADAAAAGYPIIAQIGRDEQGQVVELAVVESGKMGSGLQLLLAELGIRLSRCLQGRDPETGSELEASGE